MKKDKNGIKYYIKYGCENCGQTVYAKKEILKCKDYTEFESEIMCYGYFFTCEIINEIRDIWVLKNYYGDISKKSNIIKEVLLECEITSNSVEY